MASVIEALRYMIGASWEGERDVKKASGDIRDLGETTERTEQKSTRSWANIGKAVVGFGAAVGGAMIAAREAYQLIGEGADLLRAEDQFGRLAESIDSTADSMMGRLREATRGMVSDAELVQNATQIMSLGLQDTEDGVVRLTNVAGQLGWDMSQVILTMANNSKMRLDALGLSIADVDAKTEALVAQGKTLDEAFDLAVIEAGEEKIRLLGDSADTTAGQMQQLETAVANATDEFKVELARGFADGLAEISGSAGQAASDLQVLTGAVGGFLGRAAGGIVGTTASRLTEQQNIRRGADLGIIQRHGLEVNTVAGDYERLLELLAEYDRLIASNPEGQKFQQQARDVDEVVVSTERLITAIDGVPTAMDPAASAMARYGEFVFQGAGNSEKMAAVMERFPGLLQGTSEMAWLAAAGMSATVESMGGVTGEASAAELAIEALNEELDRLSGRNVEAHISISAMVGEYFNAPGYSNYDYNAMGTQAQQQGDIRPVAPSSPTYPRAPQQPDGGIIINNYNRDAAAINAAMLGLARQGAGNALIGR